MDWIRSGASQFRAAGLCIGHHADNPIDEARTLVLHALGWPDDGEHAAPHWAQTQLLEHEHRSIARVLDRRIQERIPAAYLIGSASFAGIRFRCDARALVPRSPIAELIEHRFQAWFEHRPPRRILDLCCGGGSIGIASALHLPESQVDLLDLSPEALALARENVELHALQARVRVLQSDLYAAVAGESYDLILSNPPYITRSDFQAMPEEYRHEPEMALVSGVDGLDHPLRILVDSAKHLNPGGILILEVGEAKRALQRRLPELSMQWLKFSVGDMGIAAIRRDALVQAAPALTLALQGR